MTDEEKVKSGTITSGLAWTDKFPIYNTIEPPKYAGRYAIGESIQFALTKKPRWLARTMCRLLLDWRWEDDR